MTNYDVSQPSTSATDKTLAFAAWAAMAIPVPFLGIIGVIIALVDKGRANPVIDSHYSYLIRTFVIGCVFALVSFVLTFVLIGVLTMLFTVLWYYIRVVKGIIRLARDERIEQPTTWLI